MHILIVDDERPIVDLLTATLQREGHDVVGFHSAKAGIEYLTTHALDMLITDLLMPGPNGLEVIRHAKKHQPDAIVLVITGHASLFSVQDGLNAGIGDVLLKPFRLEELRLRVALAAQRRRAVEALRSENRQLQDISREMIDGLQQELAAIRRLTDA